ncbi:MAG: hypothetical protein H6835_13645 [Planctomycetes bacterium]|nr:hypothetical protein [Planctomycetota bacterium]
MSWRPSRSQPNPASGVRPIGAPRGVLLGVALGVAACGGGGGGGVIAPVQNDVRIEASPLTITGDDGELLVSLSDDLRTPPALLQVAIALPPQLRLPAADRLQQARPLTTLDGDTVDGAFVVLCGDAVNAAATPLGAGPLFRLRLQPTQPRTPGTYQVQLREVRASTADGASLAAASAPLSVPVTLQD